MIDVIRNMYGGIVKNKSNKFDIRSATSYKSYLDFNKWSQHNTIISMHSTLICQKEVYWLSILVIDDLTRILKL